MNRSVRRIAVITIIGIIILNTSEVFTINYLREHLTETYINTLFIGDSQTICISKYNFLPERNVAAKKGLSLTQAIKNENIIRKLKMYKPKNVFILFGHNDIYKSTDVNEFINNYKKMLDLIKSISPMTTIYVESITPVSARAENKYPFITNKKIVQFNQALKIMADGKKLWYIDIANLIIDSGYSYLEPDGIHLRSSFYPKLLNYLCKKVKL